MDLDKERQVTSLATECSFARVSEGNWYLEDFNCCFFFSHFCSDVCQFPRSWLLPVMRDNVCETEMMYFFEKLLPLANKLHLKGTPL